MNKKESYSGYKICSALKANEKCFRLQRYDQGEVNELFHEHVPKHRISRDNAGVFMKTLLVKHLALGDPEILRTYLNSRGKKPSSINLFQAHVEYPEPGVMRIYFSGGNTTVWVDEVIVPNEFRDKDGQR